MMTTEQALDHIWNILHSYAEDSLGNKIGQDEDSMEYADEWSEICLAMSVITDCTVMVAQMAEEEPMINQYVEE